MIRFSKVIFGTWMIEGSRGLCFAINRFSIYDGFFIAELCRCRNFYEMVRFDFVLDDELNVYLMEVNLIEFS